MTFLKILRRTSLNGMRKISVTKKEARELLKLSYRTFNSHLKCIGISNDIDVLTEKDLEKLYALQLFLSLKKGVNSKETFTAYLEKNQLSAIKDQIRAEGINWDYVFNMFLFTVAEFQKTNLGKGIYRFARSQK